MSTKEEEKKLSHTCLYHDKDRQHLEINIIRIWHDFSHLIN